MSKQHTKPGQLLQRPMRQERGFPVSVETHKIRMADGSPGTVSTIALQEAEVPDRSYVGDECAIDYSNDTVRIAFAQCKLGGKSLRSLVLISMTPTSAMQFMDSVVDMNQPGLAEIARVARVTPEKLMEFPDDEPDQTVGLLSNIVALAVHGPESTLDFYHSSAFSYLMMNRVDKSKLYLEPVVRVNVRTSLLLALMARLTELRAKFPELPKALQEDRT